MSDIWQDPMVKEALADGRTPDDIYVIYCPRCGKQSYYNQGSHFNCRHCGTSFEVVGEGESMPGVPTVQADEAITLADTAYREDGP